MAEEVLPVLPVHGLEVNAKLLPEQPRALQQYRVVCRLDVLLMHVIWLCSLWLHSPCLRVQARVGDQGLAKQGGVVTR
eukprot:scaffold128248_cov48-Phaeocystis_antarctica.AAC.1